MFNIRIKRRALRKLTELDEKRRRRVKETISVLKSNPIPFRKLDTCKLRGYGNIYRIRIGDLRIVYEVLWAEGAIIIHYIGPREKSYERI